MSAKDERYATLFEGEEPDVDITDETDGVVIAISDGEASRDIELTDKDVSVDEAQDLVRNALEDESPPPSLLCAGLKAATNINRALFYVGCTGVSAATVGLFRTRETKTRDVDSD